MPHGVLTGSVGIPLPLPVPLPVALPLPVPLPSHGVHSSVTVSQYCGPTVALIGSVMIRFLTVKPMIMRLPPLLDDEPVPLIYHPIACVM